jgi:chemotaxis protein MotB
MSGNAPIIKKVKKVSGHGHHGGAWKVAYADFVTAMMAFFLLLWLLSSTTEDQRKGIAEYFSASVPLIQMSGGGESAFQGDSMTAQDTKAETGAATQDEPMSATPPSEDGTPAIDDQGADAGVAPGGETAGAGAGVAEGGPDSGAGALAELQTALQAMSGESEVAAELMRHIRTKVTNEGLVIEVFETPERPLFVDDTDAPTPLMRGLMAMIASVAQLVTNDMAVTGHTDAASVGRDGEDGAWRLSSDRALTARRLLTDEGLGAERVKRVAGRAATQPMTENPLDPQNRRIEITLLRRNALF